MATVKITKTNFKDEVTNSKKPVIIDFWASWCGPCQMMGPVFEDLSNDPQMSHVKFAKINTEEEPELANLFQIRGIPSFVAFSDGSETDRFSGFAPIEPFKEKINSIFPRIEVK